MSRSRSVVGMTIAILVIILLAFAVISMIENWSSSRGPFDITGLIASLLVAILLIVLIVRLAFGVVNGPSRRRHDRRRNRGRPLDGDTEEVLDRRYVNGEITREQYHQMKEDIQGDSPGTRP